MTDAPLYIPVAEARDLAGIRVAFTRGIPNPWCVAARAILELKGLSFVAVAQEAMGANEELFDWTGQNSAPVLVVEQQRPRSGWAEILLFAERLSPMPSLIPADEEGRIQLFGLAHGICGEDGLGWALRSLYIESQRAIGAQLPTGLLHKYALGQGVEHDRNRLNAIITMLVRRFDEQRQSGSSFLLGDRLSAVDIYWTAFSILISPPSDKLCNIPDFYRDMAATAQRHLDTPPPSTLLAHRDRIFAEYLRCPMIF